MLESHAKDVPVQCRINMDATSFRVDKDGILQPVVFDGVQAKIDGSPITREEMDTDQLMPNVKVCNQLLAIYLSIYVSIAIYLPIYLPSHVLFHHSVIQNTLIIVLNNSFIFNLL